MRTESFGICTRLAVLLVVASMIGCGTPESNSTRIAEEAPAAPAQPPVAERAPEAASDAVRGTEAAEAPPTVLFVGTSLTAGLGLPESQSFPVLIENRIREADLPYRVVNAGVSGETSAGALRRIDWLLRQPFDVLVLETGANDMLRGIDPDETERNIQAIIDRVRAAHPELPIVLAGMLALPNLGEAYGRRFEAIYPRLAERNELTLVPFLLEGVGGDRELNQSDGIHPNAEGQRVVAETVWSVLEPLLVELDR